MRSARRALLSCGLAAVLAAGPALGCAVTTQMLAAPQDLADYRAWRVASHLGARLARAEIYLAAHPDGAWADEVRASFAEEEPAYFEAAKASRKQALEYLVYLPTGPHAAAAKAVVDSFDESAQKLEIARILRDLRHRAAERQKERERRAEVRRTILADVSLLVDPRDYGRPLAEANEALRVALSGMRTPTIGWVPRHREQTLFFTVPTREGGEDRALTVQLAIDVRDGVVVAGRIRGVDLFVGWTEADLAGEVGRDPRAEAADHVAALLGGALDPLLPEARCEKALPRAAKEAERGERVILLRACGDFSASATMGAGPGAIDEIAIRGMQGAP